MKKQKKSNLILPILSLVVSLFGWIPITGFFTSIVSLIMGILGLKQSNKTKQQKHKIISWIGISISVVWIIWSLIVLITFLSTDYGPKECPSKFLEQVEIAKQTNNESICNEFFERNLVYGTPGFGRGCIIKESGKLFTAEDCIGRIHI